MAADRARDKVELGCQAEFAAAILDNLARSHHGIELLNQQRPHALTLKVKGLQNGVSLKRLTGLGQEVDEFVWARDRVLVWLTLLGFPAFLGVLRQVLRLRYIGRIVD